MNFKTVTEAGRLHSAFECPFACCAIPNQILLVFFGLIVRWSGVDFLGSLGADQTLTIFSGLL